MQVIVKHGWISRPENLVSTVREDLDHEITSGLLEDYIAWRARIYVADPIMAEMSSMIMTAIYSFEQLRFCFSFFALLQEHVIFT